jgi:AmpD protein
VTALVLDRQGWLQPHALVTHTPSPNFDRRPGGVAPTLLVIHNISLPPGEFGGTEIPDFFQNKLNYESHPWLARLRGVTVSAHFLVRRDGTILQFVSCDDRAWHAGVSSFNGRERCNDFSIGIELEGTDTEPYTDDQYETLSGLTRAVRARHTLNAVRGHEHIAPERKTDPGPSFQWRRYARESQWLLRELPPAA